MVSRYFALFPFVIFVVVLLPWLLMVSVVAVPVLVVFALCNLLGGAHE